MNYVNNYFENHLDCLSREIIEKSGKEIDTGYPFMLKKVKRGLRLNHIFVTC